MSEIMASEQGRTTVSWLAGSFLIGNCPFCLVSMMTVIPQLSINTLFFLTSMIKPSGDMILLPINELALRPLTK